MSSTSSPLLSTYSSVSNLMDNLYNSPPLPIETPTPWSGAGSQISMSNSNPGFFPSAAHSDPGIRSFTYFRELVWLRISRQQFSQTMETTSSQLTKSYKISPPSFIIMLLFHLHHLILYHLFLLSLLDYRLLSTLMLETSRFTLWGYSMGGVQRWKGFWTRWTIVFICRGRIWRQRGTSAITLGDIWRMALQSIGSRILNEHSPLYLIISQPSKPTSMCTLVPLTKLDFSYENFAITLRLALFTPTFPNSTTLFPISNSPSRWRFPNFVEDLRTNSRKLL